MLKPILRFVILISLLTPFNLNSTAQGTRKIDAFKIDQPLVHSLFLDLLNKHRDSLALSSLKPHLTLDLAARSQADFMALKNLLTHDQPEESKSTPEKRISLFHGNFEGVGENCLFIPLNQAFKIKNQIFQVNTYSELAYCMFLSWKYSPGHYKNMITKEFLFSGFHISYSSSKKGFYAANDFGGNEYHSPSIFPNDINVSDIKFDEKQLYKSYADKVFSKSAANFIYDQLGITCFYHQNINDVKSIISGKSDGIMVDYVIREQFTCDAKNNLNNSSIYDGWPQKPIYHEKFYKENLSSEKNALNVILGAVPAALRGKHYQSNIIIIKNNYAINYTVPVTVEQADFRVLAFSPLIDTSGFSLIDTVFNFQFKNKVYFQKNSAAPKENNFRSNTLLQNDYLPSDAKVKYINITGFSSIEGDSINNSRIQNQRTAFIKSILIDSTGIDSNLINAKAIENVEDFKKDFAQLLTDSIDYSLVDLKKIYKEHRSEISEEILASHRYTEFDFELALPLNINSSLSSLEFIYAHLNELNNKEKTDFLKILLLKLQTGNLNFYVDATSFNWLDDKNLMLPLYFYSSDSASFRKYYNQNKKNKNWTEKDNFNFTISNFRYYETYSTPFLPFNQLSEYVNKITTKTANETVKKLMWLNMYLINAHYSRSINNNIEVNNSLQKFRNIYFSFDTDIDDIIKIGLFFNNFNRFDMTLELLKPKLKLFPDHEKLWFTYLSTYTFAYYPKYDEVLLKSLIDKYKTLNKKRFCSWINDENFQLLRDPIFKEAYCKDCH